MSYVATFNEASAVAELTRYDRQKTVKVTGNNAGRFAGDVRNEALGEGADDSAPPGYSIYATGEAEFQMEAFGYIIEALFLAIVMIYLVLASQFESLTFIRSRSCYRCRCHCWERFWGCCFLAARFRSCR